MEITTLLRQVSGEPNVAIKSNLAFQLTDALMTQGVQVYPPLAETTTGDWVRLYAAGSLDSQLMDIIAHPDASTDKDLRTLVRRMKSDEELYTSFAWMDTDDNYPPTREELRA